MDDKTKRGGQHRSGIDVRQDYELRDWAHRFGVTKDQVRAAVKAVGDKAADVEKHLQRSKQRRKEIIFGNASYKQERTH